MRIHAISFCWNEMAILPWAVNAWERYADKVTVYDNGSDDGSVEYMRQHGIEVIPYGNNELDDALIQHYKNNAWKGIDADLVVVADMDEIIGGRYPRKAMERMVYAGGTVCAPLWYNLLWNARPQADGLIDDCLEYGMFDRAPKTIIFNPNEIKEMNYSPGAHMCDPKGNVRWYSSGDMMCFHVNNCLSLESRIESYRRKNQRRSENNIRKGYGYHYAFSQERLVEDWDKMMSAAIRLDKIIK